MDIVLVINAIHIVKEIVVVLVTVKVTVGDLDKFIQMDTICHQNEHGKSVYSLHNQQLITFKVHFDDGVLKLINQSVLLKKLGKVVHLFNYNKEMSVFLCDSFESMKRKAQDYSMPRWVIGCNRQNKVFILNPKEYIQSNKNTSIESLIIHELVHVIINSSTYNCPIWLNEGFALWYADQVKEYDLSNKPFINPFEMDYSQDVYSCSALMIKKLFENYAESRLINQLITTKDWYNDEIFGFLALKELFEKG